MIYIGIVGSRHRSEKKAIRSILNRMGEKLEITVVSGEADGIDKEAKTIAKQMNIPYKGYPPKMEEYPLKGNDIYFERNKLIADKVDYLFAFPLDRKGGTMNTIEHFENKHGLNSRKLLIID